MERELLANIMLISISSIVILTLVLWRIEKARHWSKVRAAIRGRSAGDIAEDDDLDDDPYDIGMNDKDIL
jgi:hypothetical protein